MSIDIVNNLGEMKVKIANSLEELPIPGPSDVIYLIPSYGADSNNYTEYVWISNEPETSDGHYEHIGSLDKYKLKSNSEIVFLLKDKDIVLCKECKHRTRSSEEDEIHHELEFPDHICPCRCEDNWYSWKPEDDFFCRYGERE